MSDITITPTNTNLPPKHDQRARDEDQNENNTPQAQALEDDQGHVNLDDNLRISLEAIEQQILQDMNTVMHYYDDMPQEILEREEDDQSTIVEAEAPVTYRQAANYYQKNQQALYQKRPFPFEKREDMSSQNLAEFERLNHYWDRIESLREKHLHDIPHQQETDLYRSLDKFLTMYPAL